MTVTQNVLEIKKLQFRLKIQNKQNRDNVFSSIILFHFQKIHLFFFARHHRLKNVLLKKIDVTLQLRIQKKMLFFVTHFEVFFRLIIQHIIRFFSQSFDFIEKNKMNNEIKLNYQIHFFRFLRFNYEHHLFFETFNFIETSNLLMNAYFFRMHNMIIFFQLLDN